MFEREMLTSGRRLPTALVAAGVCFLAFTAVELYVWGVVFSYVDISLIAGLVFSIPANALLIGVGWYLPRVGISDDRYHGIAAWTLGGTVFLGLFSVITGVTFFPELLWAQLSSVRWGVSVGAGAGLLVGVLNARGIERAVTAERADVRAAEAKRNQEFLEYMNALLRHEVLNTANVIEGYAELLATDADRDSDPDVEQFVEVIRRQTDELTTVIEDARLLTQIDTEQETFESVDLNAVLEEELRNTHDRHGSTDSTLETTLDSTEDVCVRGDYLLRRVFSNILMNAVEHNDSDRKRVDVRITTESDRVTASIRDNGPGIPTEDRAGIFDTAVTKGVSHGLGLTIVARLVDRYGGDVEVAETGPEGTTVTVTLPRSTAPATVDLSSSAQTPDRSVAGR
ncbi:sensor histidine kinase [Halobaculum limi]|uniref:sensor histidine kinase n=1 Tax=Halobaculum limi TaxID=3031916 RepID=UPI00240718D2|nr:HAMP domain-containing sensor histidine kinase [Halobaculum sp. YSMS11]